MDIAKLSKFKNLLGALNQINGVNSANNFIFLSGRNVSHRIGLSLYDLKEFDYVLAIGSYKWNVGLYTNQSAKLIGMFDSDLELVDRIPLSGDVSIVGLKFTKYPGSYYNEFKPILVIETSDGKTEEIKLDDDISGWLGQFTSLFNQAVQEMHFCEIE